MMEHEDALCAYQVLDKDINNQNRPFDIGIVI